MDAPRRPSSRDYNPYLIDTAGRRGIVTAMFDLWAPEHSVLREKVVEHIFLAELARSLLLDLAMPFEVLRSVNRRPNGTPDQRAKGIPIAAWRSIEVGREFRSAGGVGRA